MPVRAALLIGCDEYSDPGLPTLPGAATDVEQLARLLLDPDVGRFDEVLTVPGDHRGTSQREIMAAIERFFHGRRTNDFLLLYFAGHGIQGGRGELIFCARDTFVDSRATTGIPAVWVSERIAQSRSSRVLVLLDCCFSGAFPAGWRPRAGTRVLPLNEVHGRGRVVMTASTATEFAYENGQLVNGRMMHTAAFTAAVITGLATGAADRDGDGKVSVLDLYGYVQAEVQAWGRQTPTMRGEIEGDLVVSHRGRLPHDVTGNFAVPRLVGPVPSQRRPEAAEVIFPRVVRAPRMRAEQSATVRRWLCSVGQRVFHDTPVLEIHFDDGRRGRTVEVLAEVEGVLRGLSVMEGERIAGESALGLVALGAQLSDAVSVRQRFPLRDGIVRTVPVKLPRRDPSEPMTVVVWWRKIGERIDIGQPLLQVRVGATEIDVTSTVGGTVRAVALVPDETATSGDVVAVVSVE